VTSKFDPENYINSIFKLNPQAMVIEQPKILKKFGFPNTYTFTKHMTEQVLYRRRGSMRLTILRPSAVNACYREPLPGWLD